MAISLLDDSLQITIYFEESDKSFDDDICISFTEDCPEDEKLFKADETNIYITPEEACLLILQLQRAVKEYRDACEEM